MNQVNEIIINRWSPRVFTGKAIEQDKITALFEAARWAPSSMNEQPWQYYYASSNDREKFARFIECLVEGNRIWAQHVPLLILSVARKKFNYKNRENRHALHDTGSANSLLALQATAMGLQAHQMGGFKMEVTLRTFGLDPELFEPATFIAVGYPGDRFTLSKESYERKTTERKRKPLVEFVNTPSQ